MALALLALPGLSLAADAWMYVPLLSIPALFLLPSLLFGGGGPPDGPDNGPGGGGGGRPVAPAPPPGGVPLPDAEQPRLRIRDHGRLSLRKPRVRPGLAKPLTPVRR